VLPPAAARAINPVMEKVVDVFNLLDESLLDSRHIPGV
jgi:hypothetical protein